MKQFIKLLFAILITSYALTSCKGKNEIGALVPANALAVGYFDTKALLEKLPFSEIKSTAIFKDANDSSPIPEWAMKILEDPSGSGIDLSKGLIMYSAKDTGTAFNIVVSGFVSSVSDFESFNKNIDPSHEITSEKGIKTMTLKNSVAGWNDKHFAYVLNVNSGVGNMDEWEEEGGSLPGISMGDMATARTYLIKVLNLSSGNSLSGEERFSSLLNKKGDIKAWINTEEIFNLTPGGAMGMFKLDDFIKDSRSAYAISFNDGSVQADQYFYYGKKLGDLIKKYKADEIKTSDFSALPINDVAGVIAFNINPQFLYQYLKLAGLDGIIGIVTQGMGLSTEDLLKSFDGKILAALGNITMKNADSSAFLAPPIDFDFLVKIGVKNKENVQKILNQAFQSSGAIVSASDLPYSLTDKAFAYSNKKNLASEFTDGKGNHKFEWADKISGHPFGLYVDIQKILSSLPPAKDSATAASINVSKAFWKDVYSKGGDAKDNTLTSETVVNLQNKSTNSLKQFNKYFDELYVLNRQKIRHLEEKEKDESTTPVADSSAL